MKVTCDASFVVRAGHESDSGHAEARDCFIKLISTGVQLINPTLLLLEVTASTARKTGHEDTARAAFKSLLELKRAKWVELGLDQARKASELTSRLRLRGADAVYASVALSHGSCLITCDDEMRERLAGHVICLSPGEWLSQNSRK